ncbi:hypothetical protein EG850_06455 [Gulosibacter macacae]|uniref:Uncharacterized protein n=1 Tax=Gulosibacter macacae TaxID=2488791 RepID=A0A3P3VYB7_9MICO|nr:hypothetical protein [Gulosibacter macacae]RRJ87038.1 hypothetical protein EG850_06455 [Gulosibacter macacae]
MLRNLGEKYSPLYFLAALGAGGMATFFFMYFMFLTPHPATPIPTFNSINAAWVAGDGVLRALIAVGYIGQVFFVLLHLVLLVWNLREFAAFRETAAYDKLRASNAGVTLMAIPLTLAMTLNGLFVAGATLVPNIWDVIELLLPIALLVFGAIGVLALRIYGRFVTRIFTGGFSFEANTGMNQLLGSFAFAMVGVGLAAGAAMSSNIATVTVGLIGSIFFMIVSMLVFAVMLPLGLKSMLRHGLAPVNSATMWLPVPIFTLWGITMVRDNHGLATLGANAGAESHVGGSQELMVILAVAIAAQAAFLLFGHAIMRRNGFYTDYVLTKKHQSPVAFTLVCPGVALGVLSFFGLHVGLVQNGVVEKFGPVYLALLAIIFVVQIVTIVGMVVLLRNQLFRGEDALPAGAAPATRELVDAR